MEPRFVVGRIVRRGSVKQATSTRRRLPLQGAAPTDREGVAAAPRPLSVCLVRPPIITAPRSFSYYGAVPPLGLAYVAAAARIAGHDVQVIDAAGSALDEHRPYPTSVGTLALTGLDVDEVVSRVDPAAAVVGISHLFLHEWPWVARLLGALRARFPGAVLVCGGENATAFADEMLAQAPALDACVLGEGEATFIDLLAAVAAGLPLSGVAGLAVRGEGAARRTPRRARIADVDGVARPAWDLFPIARYLARRSQGGVDRGASMPVLTSRGCPYICTFCSSPEMWTTRYTRRDPEDVVDEIADLVARYGVENVDIHDLTSLLTKEWTLELVDAMERRGLRISFQLPSGTRSEAVDQEVAERLHRAGCRNFTYAPESGSVRTLRLIEKKVKLDALRASARASVRAGLKTHANLIIGFPHETLADLADTFRLSQDLAGDGIHSVSVMLFAPYPGSALYRALRDEGRIVLGDRYYYSSLQRSGGSVSGYHPRLGRRTLTGLQLVMLASFFARQYATRPRRVVEVVQNLGRSRQETVMDQFLARKLAQLAVAIGAGLRARLA
jgi:radical SAM superfamily enzyme YgiQ (UPF0313 family)